MRIWNAARWFGLVLVILVLAVGLARLFGGEDTWVRDASGEWVAHGHPATLPPTASSEQPAWQRILPWAVLGIALLGLAAGTSLAKRSSASREGLDRNARFLGVASVALATLSGVLVLGLAMTLAAGACCGSMVVTNETLFALLASLGLAAFLGLSALAAYATKRVLEAHYDLKRATALLQESLDRLAGRLPHGGTP